MFRKLCGDETLDNVAIVTNMWGEVSLEMGIAREQELATDDIFFKPVIDGGAGMLRHENNTRQSAHRILQYFLNKPRQVLRIQRELIDEHKDITQTAAGVELDRELAAVQKKHREELQQIQEGIQEAMLMKDAQTKEELDQVRRQLEAEMEKVENDRQRLSSEYEDEKRKTDEKMREVMAKLAAEEAQRAQRQAEIQQLQAELERSAKASAAERQAMQQQIIQLQQEREDDDGGFWGAVFGVVGTVCKVLISTHVPFLW